MPTIPIILCSADGQTSNARRAFRTVPITFISVSRSSSKGGQLFAGMAQLASNINTQRDTHGHHIIADEWLQKIVKAHNPKATSVQLKPNPKKSASPEIQRDAEGVFHNYTLHRQQDHSPHATQGSVYWHW